MGDMTRDHSRKDYACKCACGLDAIDPELVESHQAIEDYCGFKIPVNSGCRCDAHNKAEYARLYPGQSIPPSPHLPQKDGLCHAIDGGYTGTHQRYKILEAIFRRNQEEMAKSEKQIPRIEICPTWVHMSNNPYQDPEICVIKGNFK